MDPTNMMQLIQEDQRIFTLVKSSGVLNHDYRPHNYTGRRTFSTASSLAAKHFWQTIEGAKLRIYLESNYNIGSHSQAMGAFKDALSITFHSDWYCGSKGGEENR